MRQFLALVVLCMAAARVVEASLATSHPLSLLAPTTIGALTACTMCVFYMFRYDD
jgi:hypothetical protein